MSARVLNGVQMSEAAGKRLAGVVVAVGVGFDLDPVDGQDLVGDRVVGHAWRGDFVAWFVEDVEVAWDRLRRSCARVGGRAEMLTAWRQCHHRVAVITSMPEHRHLNAALTVIESRPMGAASERREALELAEAIGGHVILVDPRKAAKRRVERNPTASERFGRNAAPTRERMTA